MDKKAVNQSANCAFLCIKKANRSRTGPVTIDTFCYNMDSEGGPYVRTNIIKQID